MRKRAGRARSLLSGLCVFFLFGAGGLPGLSAATPAYVQGNYSTPQTPQTIVQVLYNAAQTAGNLNVVIVGWNDANGQIVSVSDTSQNSYQLAVGPTIRSGALTQSIYYAPNIAGAGAGGNTVKVTFSALASYPDIRILEYRWDCYR